MERIKLKKTLEEYNVMTSFTFGNPTRVTLTFSNNTIIPSDKSFCEGFEILNEHTGMSMTQYNDLKYIYKRYENKVVLTNLQDDIYVENTSYTPLKPIKNELQDIIKEKISELSNICQDNICDGIQLNNKHYSYTTQDQSNLSNALLIAEKTKSLVPYHADDSSCMLFTYEQLFEIYLNQQANITLNQTYFNQMKLYLKSITDTSMIEEVRNIKWGTPLKDGYLEKYNDILAYVNTMKQTAFAENNE